MNKMRLIYNIEMNGINWRDEKDRKASDDFVRSFNESLGLKMYSGTWSSIDLESEIIDEFIEKANAFIKNGKAKFIGFCQLVIESEGESDWYRFYNDRCTNDAYISYKDYIECRAYKYKPNMHSDGVGGEGVIVSEKFKRVVESNNLKGVDFLWVKDTGRYKPLYQWYMPVIWSPIGRGIDHAWFNPDTMQGDASGQPTRFESRMGIHHYDNSQLKSKYNASPLIKSIISLFEPGGLTINSNEEYLNEYLPDTDFAFGWKEGDRDSTLRYSGIGRRTVYIRKYAKDILIANGVAYEEQFVPVIIHNSLPEGALKLDGHGDLPKPYFSPLNESYEQAVKLNMKEKMRYEKKEKPELKISMKDSLKLLRAIKRRNPEDFVKPIPSKSALVNPLGICEAWMDVLKITNGGFVQSEFEILPYDSIEDVTRDKLIIGKENYSDYKNTYIVIGKSICGDYYVYDSENTDKEKCEIIRITHEGSTPIGSWDEISTFIYEMIIERDAEED